MIQKKYSFTGLANLGNTCFMNSSLQVLANTQSFVDYFLNDIYQADINLVNPLGSRGEIVTEFANLMKELKNGNNHYITPAALKKTFSKYHYLYKGQNQHDSAEFLLQLLDSINEDINQVKFKPYVQITSSNNREDLVVALEHWDAHSQRNQSIVVDTFQAQYKSKIECPYCKNVSITFDPYMIVQLPVVSQKSDKGLCYYLLDKQQRQKKIEMPLFNDYNIAWLKDEIRDQLKTESVVFDWSDRSQTYDMDLQESLSQFKQKLQKSKLLVRPMSDAEIAIPFHQRIEIILHHNDSNFDTLTEPITIYFNSNTKIIEIYQYIGETYAKHFQCNFEIKLQSNSNSNSDSNSQEESCYFCSKYGCKYCQLPSSGLTLEHFKNLTSTPNFKLQLIVIWFHQGVPIVFNNQDYNQIELESEKISQQLTIYDCLTYFQQQQMLDEDNLWYCKQCKTQVQGIKQLSLYSAPQTLILHLKRFRNNEQNFKCKINSFVRYPLTLDLTKHVINTSTPQSFFDNQKSLKYKLYGVINHYGELDSGHFTAIIKSIDDNKWYCCNDSDITEIHHPTEIIQQNAYVLFYQRIS